MAISFSVFTRAPFVLSTLQGRVREVRSVVAAWTGWWWSAPTTTNRDRNKPLNAPPV